MAHEQTSPDTPLRDGRRGDRSGGRAWYSLRSAEVLRHPPGSADRRHGGRSGSPPLSRRYRGLASRTQWDGDPVSGVATGGATRTESLRAAMPLLSPDVEVVVTHDCVRPLATVDQVEAVIAAVLAGADAAIPAWESPDTLKRLRHDGSIEHLGREGILVAQSPSAYRRTTLVKVFETFGRTRRRDHRGRTDRWPCRAGHRRSLVAAPRRRARPPHVRKAYRRDVPRRREQEPG